MMLRNIPNRSSKSRVFDATMRQGYLSRACETVDVGKVSLVVDGVHVLVAFVVKWGLIFGHNQRTTILR